MVAELLLREGEKSLILENQVPSCPMNGCGHRLNDKFSDEEATESISAWQMLDKAKVQSPDSKWQGGNGPVLGQWF